MNNSGDESSHKSNDKLDHKPDHKRKDRVLFARGPTSCSDQHAVERGVGLGAVEAKKEG